ncbi:MAG: electron transfer flavoprotein subunit beta/FixA family protein [Bacteroidales bacterium]|jgi:Electron transfer flavoprotein, beta subunit|nr:electron transfer flavoprotein subunit beta/FixA family protein [Bacteroidales bacterium]MBQ1679957.1 electron transfer flavoprotein subunit beta/FixA family protein [Bacteroidales bacterium]MBQ1754445.1 electron transfer flavoprotein subunit beta/FixA family protein [Bacteroidales bacterium]MBQ1831014.1 electron transfer flavoprotein subunit beta/FixA family protein [Bacteroidales bacterium]MBQ2149740.1 electron transfer flavoprotein subunit beta/FixA family protein [Bacteroidales bacterium
MSFKIVVLAKQVPDTHNVGADAMNADGTVNRAALPTVFNPEDLKALEMALQVKDLVPGATVTVVTMGPPRAAEIIKDARDRGADDGFVLSDARFAGADTLATSYALAQAIKQLGTVDLILGGRQAIDGDTAQVGPQVAEKLEIPQITYAEELIAVDSRSITLRRRLERGTECVKAQLPVLVTVTSAAQDCRYPNVHRMLRLAGEEVRMVNADGIGADMDRLGLKGSPTKVKKIESVVLAHKESVVLEPTEAALNELTATLIKEHIL